MKNDSRSFRCLANGLIEFRKVDEFWAICCGPSENTSSHRTIAAPILNGTKNLVIHYITPIEIVLFIESEDQFEQILAF